MKPIALLLILFSLNAFAQVAGYREVPSEFTGNYAKGVIAALGDNKVVEKCDKDSGYIATRSILSYTNAVYLKEDSSQPVLVLEVWMTAAAHLISSRTDNVRMVRYYISSDGEFSRIQKVAFQELKMVAVNKGTLVKPDIQNEFVQTKEILDCRGE